METLHIGASTIECIDGDITEQDTDAIVNAANNALWMGSGVAGAIKRKGGVEIEREAIAKGPIKAGDAVITGAGKLHAKYVVHAAGMGQDLLTNADLIRRTTRRSLELAREAGCHSISFPSIGTGVGGFDVGECARIMIDEAVRELSGNGALTLVRFVLFGAEAYEAFAVVLREQPAE